MIKNCPVIRYHCDVSESGYGNAARGYLQALKTIGITDEHVHVVPAVSAAPITTMEVNDSLRPYCFGNWEGNDRIVIVHVNPGMVHMYWTPLDGRYNIAVCAWETNQLPKSTYERQGKKRTAVDSLNDFDEIWVPTRYVEKVFKECGVTKPIYVIPHVICEEILNCEIPDKSNIKKVGLYFIGGWNERKNPKQLLRAFYNTDWHSMDPIRLSFQVTPIAKDEQSIATHQWLVTEDIRQMRDALPDKTNLPQFSPLMIPQSYKWIVEKLHLQNHCFVTASRGEGFNLPALEALAMGNYVIGGGGPPTEEIADIAPGMVTVLPKREVAITPMPECRGYELDQSWYEVETEDLTNEMKAIVDWIKNEGMPTTAEIEQVREHYSPSNIGKLIEERIKHAIDVLESSEW